MGKRTKRTKSRSLNSATKSSKTPFNYAVVPTFKDYERGIIDLHIFPHKQVVEEVDFSKVYKRTYTLVLIPAGRLGPSACSVSVEVFWLRPDAKILLRYRESVMSYIADAIDLMLKRGDLEIVPD